MPIIDISRKLIHHIAVWPGDTPYNLAQMLDLGRGDSVNLTTLTLSAHTGTHVDAPLHFAADGRAIDQLDLQPYWGRAQVVSLDKAAGPLFPDDFSGYDLTLTSRLLVRSASSDLDQAIFPDQFIYPSPELADYLGSLNSCLYGTDGPSMDPEDSKSLDGHHALRRNNIALLEWLDLSQVNDGLYELVALPLKIAGGDGSPVRAVLKTI